MYLSMKSFPLHSRGTHSPYGGETIHFRFGIIYMVISTNPDKLTSVIFVHKALH